MAFIMLNPSKADHTIDDPTITRCMGFARREGMDELQVVNLFAFRATDPDDLEEWYRKTSVVETMGDQNLWYVQDTVKHANIVVAAWGAHPMAHKVAHLIINAVEPLRRQKSPMVCFGTTKNGSPKHPLYLKNEQPLIKF
jgi:hypothetical protein